MVDIHGMSPGQAGGGMFPPSLPSQLHEAKCQSCRAYNTAAMLLSNGRKRRRKGNGMKMKEREEARKAVRQAAACEAACMVANKMLHVHPQGIQIYTLERCPKTYGRAINKQQNAVRIYTYGWGMLESAGTKYNVRDKRSPEHIIYIRKRKVKNCRT